MAEKRVVELEVQVQEVIKNLQEIKESFAAVKESVDSVEKTGKDTTKKLSDGFSGVRSAVVGVGDALSFIGLTLKTLGISLIIEAFATFKQILVQNQRVADLFSKSFTFITTVFNDFVDLVLNNSQPIINFFKQIFEDPIGSIKDFGNAILENLTERFNSYLETLGFVASAVKKVFSGDFAGALNDIKSAGKEAVDVLTGVDGTVDKVAKVLPNVTKAVKDYVTETANAASAQIDLANSAKLASAQQELLRIQNLKAAEEQRQIRDDTTKSIEERIQANEKLGKILEEGLEQEKVLAEAQLAAAQAALINNETNLDLQAELVRAQASVLDVEERIGGQRSEQLTNEAGLLREKLDLQNAEIDRRNEINRLDLEGQLAVEDGILDRLELERQLAEQELNIANERLENTKAIFGEGTVEYENALAERDAAEKRYNNSSVKNEKLVAEAKRKIVADALGGLSQLLGENTVAGKAVSIAQAIINTYEGATKALGQGGIFGGIAAAGVIASGLATVKKIVATKIPGTSDTAAAPGLQNTIQQALPPAFNVVGASPINQISQALNNREPVKAYVVSSDVTTAQQLDRNIISESGI